MARSRISRRRKYLADLDPAAVDLDLNWDGVLDELRGPYWAASFAAPTATVTPLRPARRPTPDTGTAAVPA